MEVLGDGTMGGEEPLRVSWGLESLHALLPLAGELVGVLRAVVEVAVLAMIHPRQYLLPGGGVAFQFVDDEHPWHVTQPFQQLAEELLGRLLVSAALHENIEDVAILIDGPPQLVPYSIDGEKHLIEVPLIAWPGTSTPQLIGVLLTQLAAPPADRFIRDANPTCEHELFEITVGKRWFL
jgi:hypothetical protein